MILMFQSPPIHLLTVTTVDPLIIVNNTIASLPFSRPSPLVINASKTAALLLKMTPKISAQALLPKICSFSSEQPPKLQLLLTLYSDVNIKVHKHCSPFWPNVNALSIQDVQSHEPVKLPTMDVNFGSLAAKNGLASAKGDDNIIILKSGVPHVIDIDFRPFGHETFDKERLSQMGSEKWKIATTLGMHLLEIGKEYKLNIRHGMEVKNWTADTEEELSRSDDQGLPDVGRQQGPGSVAIPVEVTEGVYFRVEA